MKPVTGFSRKIYEEVYENRRLIRKYRANYGKITIARRLITMLKKQKVRYTIARDRQKIIIRW